MERTRFFGLILFAAICILRSPESAWAAVTPTGDVTPAQPWTLSTTGYVGYHATGSLRVDLGSYLLSDTVTVGAWGDGQVTITDHSAWHNDNTLYIGDMSGGTLDIVDGGALVSGYDDDYGTYGYDYVAYCRISEVSQVTVNGSGSTWTDYTLYVGYGGDGIVNILNGATVTSQSGSIGYNADSSGKVTVSGSNSTWTSYGDLPVGYSGDGTLEILDGGAVMSGASTIGYNAGSTGKVTVSGSHSSWTTGGLSVGYASSGTLEILGGASVTSTSSSVGHMSDALGEATIGGSGSQWTNTGSLIVGDYDPYGSGTHGHGILSITAGGTVTSVGGTVGNYNGAVGEVTVDGANAAWTNSGDLYLGRNGSGTSGTLAISNGGSVTNATGYVGYYYGATGDVTVEGGGSTWTNSGNLYLGYYYGGAKGTLTVTAGGAAANATAYLGYYSATTGEATVSGAGSTWTTTGDLYLGYYGGSDGTLGIADGGVVSVSGTTYVDRYGYATGAIDFDGGTLTTGSLCVSPAQLTGIGVINARGLVSDIDLTFDSTASLTQTYILQSESDQDITIHFDLASNPTANGILGAGWVGAGSLTICNGVTIQSNAGWIGGSASQVTVTGHGSTWNDTGDLSINALGTLAITDGGSVTVAGTTLAGLSTSSASTIAFGADGGTLTTQSLYASPSQLTGTGTINTHGMVSDVDLVVDSTHGLTRQFIFAGEPDQHVTVNLDMSDPNNVGDLGVGYQGNGSLVVRDGITVESNKGTIGYGSGSVGKVTVTGPGSTWNNSTHLLIGSSGNGSLVVANGGAVSDSACQMGTSSGSTGQVLVTGAGSTWTHNGFAYIGQSGKGMVAITDGGHVLVNASYFMVYSGSLLAIEVNNGSQLAVSGAGSLMNSGTIRIMAGAAPAAGGVFTPVSGTNLYSTWTYQTVGGKWDSSTNRFTASNVQAGTSGTPVSINLASVQRVRIDDATTGWTVGASFLSKTSSTSLALTATAISGDVLTDLEDQLHPNQFVLGGWEFSATGGYNSGDPAYLSLAAAIGPYTREDVQVWYCDGADWAPYDAWDLTCDGTWASFTVTGFSGYAVTMSLIPGDTDRDKDIDQDDAATLAAHWGQTGDWADGDFNGDGLINAGDAAILAANWRPGTTSAENSGSSSVPEPDMIGLFLVLGTVAITRRVRRV